MIFDKLLEDRFKRAQRLSHRSQQSFPSVEDLRVLIISKPLFRIAYPHLFARLLLICHSHIHTAPGRLMSFLTTSPQLSRYVKVVEFRAPKSVFWRDIKTRTFLAEHERFLGSFLHTGAPSLQHLLIIGFWSNLRAVPATRCLRSISMQIPVGTEEIVSDLIQNNLSSLEEVHLTQQQDQFRLPGPPIMTSMTMAIHAMPRLTSLTMCGIAIDQPAAHKSLLSLESVHVFGTWWPSWIIENAVNLRDLHIELQGSDFSQTDIRDSITKMSRSHHLDKLSLVGPVWAHLSSECFETALSALPETLTILYIDFINETALVVINRLLSQAWLPRLDQFSVKVGRLDDPGDDFDDSITELWNLYENDSGLRRLVLYR